MSLPNIISLPNTTNITDITTLPNIISFSGRKGSGKTELANVCVNYGYTVINFADHLKDIVCKCLKIDISLLEKLKNNNSDCNLNLDLSNKLDYLSNELEINKSFIEKSYDLSSFKSIREILQILGTNIIRKYNPDWHINKTKVFLEKNKDKKFCIGDCRFLNEKRMIENMSGECWFIIRPNNMDISNHISETELNWSYFNDKIIVNSMEKKELISKWENYLYKKNNGVNEFSFINKQLINDSFLYLNEELVYLLGFFNGSNVFLKDNILTIENDKILGLKHLSKELINDYNINSINIYNPFIIENLKLWNIFGNKEVPNTIRDNSRFTKLWILGLIDACWGKSGCNNEGDCDILIIKNNKSILKFICEKYSIEFRDRCKKLHNSDLYSFYLNKNEYDKFKTWLIKN